jgi:PAS domain-containing protein
MSTPSTNTGSRAGAPAMSTPTTNTGSRDGAPAEKRYHEAVGDSPSTNTGSRDGAPAEKRYHEAVGDSQFELSLRSIPELQRASSCAALAAVSVLDAANADERPTFAVDISSDHPHEGPLDLIYVNPALSAAKRLLAKTRGNASPGASLFTDADEPHVAFKGWLWGKSEERDKARRGSAYLFGDYLWCFTTVKHYAIVSGVPQALLQPDPEPGVPRRYTSIDPRERRQPRYLPQVALESATMMPTVQTAAPRTPLEAAKPTANTKSSTRYGPFDYTLDPPPQVMSEHVRNFRSVKWEKTSLGPMHTWGPQLRCVVNVVMNDNHPAVLFWGDDVTMIYNEAYIEILSLLHPCMGQSARVAAKDYWPLFQPIIDHVNATGETVCNFDMPLFLDRHGFLEETFFSFQVTSILNSTGHVAGYYQALIETTKNVLLERRVSSLVEIGSQTAKARDLRTYWDLVLNTLAINDRDAPFALLYGAEYLSAPSSSCVSSPGDLSTEVDHFVLKGSIGVDANHTIAPSSIDIKIDGSTIFHPYLIKAIRTSKPIVVHLSELELPDDMLDGIHWKGYGDPCRSVIVCPVLPTTSKQIQGFLIVGINPRRPFDEDYQQFVHVMLRLLATSLASVVLFDEEIRQKERAIGQAARIQEQLLEELQLKEKKFQRFAERSEIAIFILDAVGKFTYRNQSWYDMFETAVNEEDAMSAWTKIVFPEDIAKCEGVFAELAVQQVPICFELRTSMPWTPPPKLTQPANKDRTQSKEQEQEQEHYKWILCSAYPELDAKGRVIEIVGNVTDISKQKWAEGMQKMRTDDALEGKRHLEHFIDTTSHEMRNPLSAIMQCADGILTSYPATDTDTDNDFPTPSPTSYAEFLDQTMDAAQIIAQCAQHMKRIVDDILTISKLDSGLLAITPIDAQPESVTRHAVKMFESEAKAADVDMCLQVDQSFRDLHVDWVSLDPTRLLQVCHSHPKQIFSLI